MREIKFRGKTPQGDFVYGDLTHFNGHCFINDIRVEPGSVNQFACTDENGVDLYEGDSRRFKGRIFRVTVLPYFEELFGGKDAALFPVDGKDAAFIPPKPVKLGQLSLF